MGCRTWDVRRETWDVRKKDVTDMTLVIQTKEWGLTLNQGMSPICLSFSLLTSHFSRQFLP